MSETATIFIQTPQIPNGPDTTTVNAEPLKAYAAELREDRRPATIVATFREYDASDEILGYIEKAAEDSEEMQRVQTHALSLIFSVYPLPDDAAYDSITLISLTEEELAMPAEARLGTAKKLVVEKNYSLLKSETSRLIELCHRILQEQFNARCLESQKHLSSMRTALWAVTSLFVASLICALAVFYIWIIVPMRRYSKDIVSDRMLKKQGKIRELLSIVTAYNGLMERRNKPEEYLPGGFFIYKADKEGKLLYANKAIFDIFGCDGPEDFKKLTDFTFRGMVHPEDYDNISASITEQIKDSQADLDYVEYRIVRKDGAINRIRDYGHYVEYDDKNGLYYVFISDVTDKYEQGEA